MSLAIRTARLGDLPEVCELLRHLFAESLRPYMVYAQHGIGAYLAAALEHPRAVPNHHYLVVADSVLPEARILAFAEFRTQAGNLGFLSYICVAPDMRNRGIATQLFRFFVERHPETATLELDVFNDNDAAVALYQKLGLERCASSKWVVRDVPEAAGSVEIPSIAASLAAHRAYGFSEMNVFHGGAMTRVGRIGSRVMRCFNREDFESPSLHAGVVGVFPSVTEVLGILPEIRGEELQAPYRTVLISHRMSGSAATLKARL